MTVLAYGMSAYKLSDTMQIPVPEAQAIIDRFFAACPRVKQYLDQLGTQGVLNGYSLTGAPFYRPRFFDVPDQAVEPDVRRQKLGAIERASKNHPKLYGVDKQGELLGSLKRLSAAKPTRNGRKVQRLGKVIQTGRNPHERLALLAF